MRKSLKNCAGQKKLAAAGFGVSLVLAGASAQANLTWDFSYVGQFPDFGPHYGQQDIVNGQITTTDLNAASNTFSIVGISGTSNGAAISSLYAPGGYGTNDNLLYASSPYLSFSGFSFDAGSDKINIYYNAAAGAYWDWYDSGATLATGGTFTVSQINPQNLTWTNAGANGLWDNATTANWNNGTSTAAFNAGDNVTFNSSNGGAANFDVTLNSTVSPGSITVDTTGGNYSISGSGSISGAGALVKKGAGVLTISTAVNYTGSTGVDGGTLKLVGGTLGSASTNLTGTLEYNESANAYQAPITYTGTGVLRETGTGNLIFGATGAVHFNFSAGALIDVQGGTFTGSSSYGGIWTSNLASLNIAGGATFNAVEAGPLGQMQIDALSGSGTLLGGYFANTSGTSTLTIGAADGSGGFSGKIQDNPSAHLAVIKTGAGTETFSGTNTYTGSTTVNAGTLVIANSSALPDERLFISGGLVQLGTSIGQSKLTALSITSTGKLDITNNRVLINYGQSDPLSSIVASIKSGYNNGAWNGSGIISSAITDSHHGIGYIDDGAGSLNFRYTLSGDTNLDGSINFSDLVVLAQNYNSTHSTWGTGDFNYDGTTNFADLVALAQNYNGNVGPGEDAGLSPSFVSDWNLARAEIVAVPEPASVGLMLMAGMGLMRRGRKQTKLV